MNWTILGGLAVVAAGSAVSAHHSATLAPETGLVIQTLEDGMWRPVRPAPGGSARGRDGSAVGCHIYIRWHGWTARIDHQDDQHRVKIRGLLWVKHLPQWKGNVTTNGRVWNWKLELQNDNCDKQRQYRFRIYGVDKLDNGSTNRYAGVERYLYYPSSTTFTTKVDLDLGYLDGCLAGVVTCNKPYYPTNKPTPHLDWP